jgi:hypothetical protein
LTRNIFDQKASKSFKTCRIMSEKKVKILTQIFCRLCNYYTWPYTVGEKAAKWQNSSINTCIVNLICFGDDIRSINEVPFFAGMSLSVNILSRMTVTFCDSWLVGCHSTGVCKQIRLLSARHGQLKTRNIMVTTLLLLQIWRKEF